MLSGYGIDMIGRTSISVPPKTCPSWRPNVLGYIRGIGQSESDFKATMARKVIEARMRELKGGDQK
jgi:hypothetical protein